jgi:hypothetical protein
MMMVLEIGFNIVVFMPVFWGQVSQFVTMNTMITKLIRRNAENGAFSNLSTLGTFCPPYTAYTPYTSCPCTLSLPGTP